MRYVSIACAVQLLVAVSFATEVRGSECNCEAALVQDFQHVITHEWETTDYLNIIDETSFNTFKRDAHAAASLPIDIGVMIGASADYSTFEENRRTYFSKTQFTRTREESKDFLQQITPTRAYQSYDHCLDLCFGTPHAVQFNLVEEGVDFVNLKYVYRSQQKSDPSSVKLTGTLENGRVDGLSDNILLAPGESAHDRQPGNLKIHRIDPNKAWRIELKSNYPNADPFTYSQKAVPVLAGPQSVRVQGVYPQGHAGLFASPTIKALNAGKIKIYFTDGRATLWCASAFVGPSSFKVAASLATLPVDKTGIKEEAFPNRVREVASLQCPGTSTSGSIDWSNTAEMVLDIPAAGIYQIYLYGQSAGGSTGGPNAVSALMHIEPM